MDARWRLPREFEEPFRDALDHAAKRRIGELRALLQGLTDQQTDVAVNMCGFVCAYTAINTVSRRWPTDGGLRLMAEKATEGTGRDAPYGVTEQNVYLFLSKCALGFKTYPEVFADAFDDPDVFLSAPFHITVNLLGTFVPKDKTIWEFLDVIEDAYEKAWLLDLNLLPALMVRARMPQPEGVSDASGGSR
ncbi:MAG: hypothetical protein J2P25_14170 [Nocardiopsaceae bacterium]|nr:hypothetical protein [Nocardiopsaceae bacterium]